MRQTEIIDYIKEQHPQFSEQQIKASIRSFYKAWRYYATRPLESKGGILINGLMTIWIKPQVVSRYLDRLELKELELSERKLHPKKLDRDFYEQLLKNIIKYERQTGKGVFNAGSIDEISDGGADSIAGAGDSC